MILRRLIGLGVVLALAARAQAQQATPQVPQPKIYALYPCGAKAGTSVEVRISSGSDLDGIDRLVFSHPGITAQALREEPSRLYPQGRALEGKFKVTVAAGVPAGLYEVRAAGYFGLTNARRFSVGDQEELLEKEPNNDPSTAQEPPLGAVVNGTCDPQNYDCFRLSAKKGKRYLAQAAALRIDSRAQIVLTLLDPDGRELRRVVATRSHDALLDFTPESDGAYTVQVHDLLYRGGDEYFYRFSIGTGPWIDFVDPPVLKPGADNAVTVYGRNLPGGAPAEGVQIDGCALEKLAVTIKAPAEGELPVQTLLRPGDASADLVSWNLPGSNSVRLLLSPDAPTPEVEPNDTPDKAQAIQIPALIVGRFNPRGDRDWYSFEATKGDRLWIEVTSQRLGLPVDPEIVIQQAGETSKDLQEVDDLATPLPTMANNLEKKFHAHSDDAAIVFTVPATGKYRLLVKDLFGSAQGDPRLFYVLAVRPPRPDFRLVAFPLDSAPVDNKFSQSNCIVRRGGSDRLKIIAYRREGFDGTIKIEAEGLPHGLLARPALIGPAESSTDFIFTAQPDAPAYAGPVRLVARSGDTTRRVLSAEVLWNVADMQREPVVTRLTETVGVGVDDHFVAPLSIQAGAKDESYRMSRGGKLKIPVKLVKSGDAKDLDKAQIKIVTAGFPGKNNDKSIAAKELSLSLAKPDGELELDISDKAPVGPLTFHLTGDLDVSYVRNPERVKRAQEEQKRIDTLSGELAAEVKKAGDERAKSEKQAAEAASAVTKLKAAGQTEAPLKEAEEKAKAAEEARTRASEAEKKLQALAKAADAAKKECADEVKKSTDAAKEKKVKVWFTSLSIPLEILGAPATLKTPAAPVALKPGDKAEVDVEVTREFGFADEVKVELAGGTSPVKLASALTIAGGQNAGKAVLVADKAAKPGTYSVTLRASVKWNAKPLTVDRTLQVTIESPPQ